MQQQPAGVLFLNYSISSPSPAQCSLPLFAAMAPTSHAARGKNIQTAAQKKVISRRLSDRGLATPPSRLASVVHRKTQVTRSVKAGLHFPVGRIGRYLKEGGYSQCFGSGAPVYLAAVLKSLAAKVLELAGHAAKERKKTRIIPRDLFIAFMGDKELGKLLDGVTIPDGGVVPYIHKALLVGTPVVSQLYKHVMYISHANIEGYWGTNPGRN